MSTLLPMSSGPEGHLLLVLVHFFEFCYQLAEPLCHSLNCPWLLHVSLMGQWRYSLNTEKLTATMRIAERVCSHAEEQPPRS
jgi:hypothetical protein